MTNTSQRSVLPPRLLALLPLAAGVFAITGCVVEERTPRRTVYVERGPVVEEAVIVEVPPPPLREEIVVVRPSPGHFWIRGYWAWQGGRHVWLGGHWELPPRPGCVWEEPRWEHRERGYVFVAGRWNNSPVVVKERVGVSAGPVKVNVNLRFVAQPPPPPRHEVVVVRERPSEEHLWIKGYWVWRENRHVWIGGHWERPPHPHAVWVEPRWERHAEGHLFIEGYWR